MVSLFEMHLQRPLWSHLTTSIPTLDLMIALQSEAILDFQTVPANNAMLAVVCQVIASHLGESSENKVVVIETFNKFPWDLLRQHPGFVPEWLDRVRGYRLTTFAQVLSFFIFHPLGPVTAGSVMVFVCNFHELVDHYRLQLSAAYEEALLKHQIDKNAVLLANHEKIMEEGLSLVELQELPPQSALLKENPILKLQNHINELFKHMSDFAFKYALVVVLMGHLHLKFKAYTKKKLPPSMDSSFLSQASFLSSPTPSFSDNGRMVLMPVTFGKEGSGRNGANLNDSKLTARLIFYNDWFHKSPFSQTEAGSTIKPRLVSAVKVTNLNGIGNINDPVYFDYDDGKYDGGPMQPHSWFVDLLGRESEDLSSLIQNSLSSTQQQPRRTTARPITLPSSPTVTRTQLHATVHSSDIQITQPSQYNDNVLVIDGSDVELTGTVFDDLDEI